MKILFATSEAVPYFKSGGLADVSRTLPDALAAAGHDIRIILPFYSAITIHAAGIETETTQVPWLAGTVPTRYVTHTEGGPAPAVLVDQPGFFHGGSPYSTPAGDPLELGRRFAFFCRAIVHYARHWKPDVIHLNDWTTGLVPVWGVTDDLDAATVFAIHNLAYQGNFPPALVAQTGIPPVFYRAENGIEFHGVVSFLKAGLALSDRLVTVSPTYAREIQTPAYGAGLEGLLHFRRRVLHGILNGIDTGVWNPARDPNLAATYNAKTLGRKMLDRDALIAESGLDGGGPIVAMVTRLAVQKGIDLVLRALPHLLEIGARLVVLGDGDAAYERELAAAARAAPSRIATVLRFDDALAHRIYAGADFFLMPSRYEPCGLGQMIAQRYGTPPIARHTGGLVDTVTHEKTGFLFDDASPAAVVGACRHAFDSWRARGWNALQRRCMATDWSWARSAALYAELYRLATGRLSR
ncbi:MAG: glycogen synthase [Longimicrobiales bacterium]